MKTIGLLGGMSWESTATYYKIINQEMNKRLGSLHSAQLLLYSVDFEEMKVLQHEDRWDEAAQILVDAALSLEKGGADFILICTNTMHCVADIVEASIQIPILHIADATAEVCEEKNLSCLGLLGTRFTMEEDFYKKRLIGTRKMDVIIPHENEREDIHRIIYQELCGGKILDSSRSIYIEVISSLAKRGAQGIILGCTEIGLLVEEKHVAIPLIDTAEIHALKAVVHALM